MCGFSPYSIDPEYPNYYTTDGGKTWQLSNKGTDCYHPLAIPGTGTFFATDDSGNYTVTPIELYKLLYRSDDSGKTWRFISLIPVSDSAHYAPSTHLSGDLNHIYTQTSAGVLLSNRSKGSLGKIFVAPTGQLMKQEAFYGGFYQKSNYIYCSDGHEINDSAHLWYLNLDSLIDIFPTTFAFSDSTKYKTVSPGQKVTINFSPQTTDPIGIDSGHIVIHFDSTSLLLDLLALPPTWVIRDSTSGPGYLNLYITADSKPALA